MIFLCNLIKILNLSHDQSVLGSTKLTFSNLQIFIAEWDRNITIDKFAPIEEKNTSQRGKTQIPHFTIWTNILSCQSVKGFTTLLAILKGKERKKLHLGLFLRKLGVSMKKKSIRQQKDINLSCRHQVIHLYL